MNTAITQARSLRILFSQLFPKKSLLRQHVLERKAALRDRFHQSVIQTHWDAPRHVYQAWVGDGPFEKAEHRAEFGRTEAGVLRRLFNKRAIPLVATADTPDAASQDSRPNPDMHVADAMEHSRHERKQKKVGWQRFLGWFAFLMICAMAGVIAFLIHERHADVVVIREVPAPVIVPVLAPEPAEPRNAPPVVIAPRTRRTHNP